MWWLLQPRSSQTRSRRAKADLIATLLTTTTDPVETEIVVTYLSGELRQRRTGVGWRTLAEAPAPATTGSLTVEEVDRAFAELAVIAGTGSQGKRREGVNALFARATAEEQRFLRLLVGGELPAGRARRCDGRRRRQGHRHPAGEDPRSHDAAGPRHRSRWRC